MDPYKREAPTDRELAAQGVGNIMAGMIGGLPLTGVIVRSAANVDAGAQTKMAAIIHGVLLLIAVCTIPVLLNQIPLASLAAILIYTGYKLAHPSLIRYTWSQGYTQFMPFVVTVVAILLTDLLVGISLGLAVGFIFILLDHLRYPCYTVVSPPGSVLTRVQLQDQVSFLNKASLVQLLENTAPGSRIEVDGSACRHVDHDVLEFISDFRQTAEPETHRLPDGRTVASAGQPEPLVSHGKSPPSLQQQPGVRRGHHPQRSRVLPPPRREAGAALPVHRLRRQPRAARDADGRGAGGDVRAPEHRQPGDAGRPEPAVRPAVCRGRAGRAARHRVRPLPVRRRARGDYRPLVRRGGLLAVRHSRNRCDGTGRSWKSSPTRSVASREWSSSTCCARSTTWPARRSSSKPGGAAHARCCTAWCTTSTTGCCGSWPSRCAAPTRHVPTSRWRAASADTEPRFQPLHRRCRTSWV